ncbi:Peptidase M56 BlaR1 [Desulfitobacterium hafniense]|uniref:Peptidase M56 BlaR1 n=1 Tax=Desulfitobacterium hafniense TaxID=49338 RepID=A0A098AXB1_DESHA|nr:M56 family metallopeptidase [Desulfitobacterium hafniense]CDX00757.1 Peptidase M56 BlaR1 [Desulfitobacterium hafniense]
MQEELFLKVLNMSITGSAVILCVVLMRFLLRRAPKVFSYALWSVVLFRLVCPFSFESALSLLPVNPEPIPHRIVYAAVPQIQTGITAVDRVVSSSLPGATPYASVNPLQIWVFLGSLLWIMGIAVLLLYSVFSLLSLKKRLKDALHDKENIYLCDSLDTPFVMGVLGPRIYLPASLSGAEKEYILLHEQTHIRRFDHVVKILSFFVLCIHWFNPLVWAAFFLSGRDMEMSCDEAVIRKLGHEVKKDYSSSLLSLATGRPIVGGTPLAFGEGDTRGRIMNVLNYKKPGFRVLLFAFLAVFILGMGMMANPKAGENFTAAVYRVDEILYSAPQYSFAYTTDSAPQYNISSDYVLFRKEVSDQDWVMLGSLYEYPLSRQEQYGLFDPLNNKAHENLDKVKTIYRADLKDENQTLILVMEQKNGHVLLAHGYDHPGNPRVRWLFHLDKVVEPDANGQAGQVKPQDDRAAGTTEAEPMAKEQDPLEKAVSAAILQHNRSEYTGGDFSAQAHTTLATETGESVTGSGIGTVTVYAMALYMEFGYRGGGLSETGGSHMPVALTFEVEDKNTYRLMEYWTPQDGAGYGPSIREKFPEKIAGGALDTQKYIQAHVMACYEQAIAYGQVDVGGEIAGLIETICSSPAHMSNPGAYIDAHPLEYRTLVYYGSYTLEYCFDLFAQGGQRGLEGHIMAAACRDIMMAKGASFDDMLYNTGQDWYDSIKDWAVPS